ncbi:MAG TPA: site-specific DNA-methyltransferase [Clostridiales bacterium]|nr:site-specific DNA-methyltransferase [Clostridiales bacterium]
MNKLYYGDNLDILRRYVKDETIDLIYLDPPFNSKATYNVLFGNKDEPDASAQIKAFDDTWHWDQSAAESFREVVEKGGDVSRAMQAFRLLLNDSDMLAYLSMMAPRLVEMHRVLTPDGSIYLHCDPTASHYLKILMDAVFGADNFLNEIIWSYKRYTAASTRFQRLHDVIFFYGKTDQTKINDIREPYGEKSGKLDSHYKQDEDGEWFRWQKRKGKEPYKIYLSKGRRIGDVWEISIINASAKERLGYPTQKPEELLERIIKASSNEGDLVLDPFCGCGTTVAVAQKLNREWIGIDITHLAINLMKHRLRDTFADEVKYEVIGEPVSLEGAQTLAKQDPYQFQWWALGLVGARPSEEKKGADAGIDGRIYFHDEANGNTKQVIISVKAGKPHLSYMRDLRGVVDRESAEIGVLITMQDPTQPMRAEAASGGFYESPGWGERYPKLQILTIEDLLEGKGIDMPPIGQVNVTFKKAPKTNRDEGSQPELGLGL